MNSKTNQRILKIQGIWLGKLLNLSTRRKSTVINEVKGSVEKILQEIKCRRLLIFSYALVFRYILRTKKSFFLIFRSLVNGKYNVTKNLLPLIVLNGALNMRKKSTALNIKKYNIDCILND